MRANASGLVVFVALGHDHVHRCNIRIEFSSPSPSPFVQSTYGSHHTRLVNDNALLWNILRKRPEVPNRHALQPRPLLPRIDSGETFGLVQADLSQVEDELLELKPEDSEDPDAIEREPDLLDVAMDTLDNPHVLLDSDLPAPPVESTSPQPPRVEEVIVRLPLIVVLILRLRFPIFITQDLTSSEDQTPATAVPQPSPPTKDAHATVATPPPTPRNSRSQKRKRTTMSNEECAVEERAQKSQKKSSADDATSTLSSHPQVCAILTVSVMSRSHSLQP